MTTTEGRLDILSWQHRTTKKAFRRRKFIEVKHAWEQNVKVANLLGPTDFATEDNRPDTFLYILQLQRTTSNVACWLVISCIPNGMSHSVRFRYFPQIMGDETCGEKRMR